MSAFPARLHVLLLIAAVLGIVLVVTNLPEPKPAPEPGSVEELVQEMERLIRMKDQLPPLPREATEPHERLNKEEIRRALLQDPVAFVSRQLEKEDGIEKSLGLMAIRDVAAQQGPVMFRSMLRHVQDNSHHPDHWVRVHTLQALVALRSLDPAMVDRTFRTMLEDPSPGVRLFAGTSIARAAENQRLQGSAADVPALEEALLQAANRDEANGSWYVAIAGAVGGQAAAAAILARLNEQEHDPDSRRHLLWSLGLCGREHAGAATLLWREAFDSEGSAEAVSGARRGLWQLAADEELGDISAADLQALRRDAADDRSSALLLARIARARSDPELARVAASALAFELAVVSDVLETARELISLADLTQVPQKEIRSSIDRFLEEPPSYVSWEYRVALRELRDELR